MQPLGDFSILEQHSSCSNNLKTFGNRLADNPLRIATEEDCAHHDICI